MSMSENPPAAGPNHTLSHAHALRQEFGDRFHNKRILVTGATGFVGLNLCEVLDTLGAEVVGAALPDSIARSTRAGQILPVDLSVEGTAQRMIDAADPEIVFHLAGLVDTRQSSSLVLPTLTHNLLGTVHLMAGLVGTRCQRVVLVTSSEAPPPGQSPNSPYAASKLAMVGYAEMYGALYRLPVVIARPHMVYGPHQPPDKLIPYLIRCGLEHIPPKLSSGTRLCDPTYVMDLVRALLYMAMSDLALGLTLDVGTGKGISVSEIAALVLHLMHSDLAPVFGAVPDRVSEPPQVADIRSTEAALNWKPAWSFEAGLSETIRWFRERGELGGHAAQPAQEVHE
jgi:UDP-glucose 4-epimerase